MSKTGDTKKKIVEMLEQKNETLTDISTKLGLAPSTVSQHLQELVDSGSIRLVEDRPRKWKYYEINKGQQTKGFQYYNTNYQKVGRALIPLAIIAIALIAAVAFFGLRNNLNSAIPNTNAQQVYLAPGSTAPSGSTIFTVSDSPPLYNVSALFITVDNASIRSASTGKWYKIPLQASTFNLVQLDNISSLLSGVKLSSGTYDDMVLYISNVSAVVNGTKEGVFLPTGKLLVVGDFNISNSTTNWINVDFDLAHSIHITTDGKLIMLPVITVRDENDSDLQLNESSIIVARAPVDLRRLREWGMNQNGSLVSNYSVPQNWNMSTVNGGLQVGGRGAMPILIRTNRDFIIGGDAGRLFNISISNSSISSVGINGSANQQAIIAYRKCLGIIPGNSQSGSVSNNSSSSKIAIAVRGCCVGLPSPVIGVNSGVNGSGEVGNASLVTTQGVGRPYPPIGRCCYPIVVASPSGNARISIRRCLPMAVGLGSNAIINSSWENNWNSTQINITMNRAAGGNFNEQCAFQNGALECNSNGSVRPQDIIAGIGGSIAAWSNSGIVANSTVGSNSTVGGIGGAVGIGSGGANAGGHGGASAHLPIGNV